MGKTSEQRREEISVRLVKTKVERRNYILFFLLFLLLRFARLACRCEVSRVTVPDSRWGQV